MFGLSGAAVVLRVCISSTTASRRVAFYKVCNRASALRCLLGPETHCLLDLARVCWSSGGHTTIGLPMWFCVWCRFTVFPSSQQSWGQLWQKASPPGVRLTPCLREPVPGTSSVRVSASIAPRQWLQEEPWAVTSVSQESKFSDDSEERYVWLSISSNCCKFYGHC